MSTLQAEFKFKIGDILQHKTLTISQTHYMVEEIPRKVCVIERHLQQCPGGI